MEYHQIEAFSNENEVMERIKELKAEGISENQIHVIADTSEDASTLTQNFNIHYTDAEGSFADKLSSFFTGSAPEEKVLERFNMSEGQQDAYVTDLKEGRILLYTDEAQDTSSLTSEAAGMSTGAAVSNTRSGTTDESQAGATSDSGSGVINDSVDGRNKHVESGYMDSDSRETDTADTTATGVTGESSGTTDTSVGENDDATDLARSQPNVDHEGGDVSEEDLRAYDDAGARSQPNKDVEDELDDFEKGTSNRDNTARNEGTTTNDSDREMTYADEVYSEEVVRDEDFTDDTVGTSDTDRTTDSTTPSHTDDVYREEKVRDEAFADDIDHATTTNNDFASGTTGEDVTTDRASDTSSDKEKMELHEEKLDVDKHRKQAGEVEINKETVRDKEEFDVPVTKEEVTVERRPVNEERDAESTSNQTEGVYEDEDSIRVPVHEEEVEVNKKDVVKEEIVVDKKEKKDNVHVEEEVRKEEADISDTTDNDNNNEKRNR